MDNFHFYNFWQCHPSENVCGAVGIESISPKHIYNLIHWFFFFLCLKCWCLPGLSSPYVWLIPFTSVVAKTLYFFPINISFLEFVVDWYSQPTYCLHIKLKIWTQNSSCLSLPPKMYLPLKITVLVSSTINS